MDEETSSRPQREQREWRSQQSNNWRVPDGQPRPEPRPKIEGRGGGSQQGRSFGTKSPSTPESTPGTRLYVGNLLYSAQTGDVEQLFTENGFTITKVNMSTDPFSGRNPSYCFVDLETPDDASRAMAELTGKEVLGRPVRINPGVAKRSSEGGPQARVKSYEGGWGAREERGPVNENYKPTFDRWSRNDASSHYQSSQEQGTRVYVGGLPRLEPQSAVDAEMQKIFEGFELSAVSKIISPHQSMAEEPGNHYYLFVDLTNPEDVLNAVQKLNGMELEWGGQLKVSKARDNKDRKVRREQGDRNTYSREGGGGGRWSDRNREES